MTKNGDGIKLKVNLCLQKTKNKPNKGNKQKRPGKAKGKVQNKTRYTKTKKTTRR